MDFANRIYGQCAELLRAMTPRARLTVALLAVVVLASFVYLGRQEFAGDTMYLLGGQELSPSEVTAMQGALGKAKLSDFAVEGNRIRIPRVKQAAYLAALADGNALPQTLTDIFSEATDKTTWFTSRQQQLDQARTAKKKGLALMLRDMHGVESADVDFDKEEPRGLRRDRIAAALVALKLQAGQTLDEDRAAFFQRTVAAALIMAPHDVTVVDKVNHVVFGGRGSNAPADDLYRDLKRKYQADYEENVRKSLAYVPGVTVNADVELDRELRREERRIEFDANQPANLATPPAAHRGASMDLSNNTSDVPGAQNQTKTEIAGLTPKRVSIAVGVPNSYFENIIRQRQRAGGDDGNTAPAAELAQVQAEEITRIRQHVAGLIPSTDTSAGASPAVTVTPFSTLSAPEPPPQSFSSRAIAWLTEAWSTLAALAVALVGLLMLRSMVRVASIALVKRSDAAQNEAAERRSRAPAPSARFRAEIEQRVAAGRSIRDEVADLVRDDPAGAANILRSWIGNTNY